MKFDNMRFILAHTIAKNEGAANPMRLAMLSAMLDVSMPVSLLITQKLARREVASQPVVTPSPESSPGEVLAELQDVLVGEKYQFANAYLSAPPYTLNYEKKAAEEPQTGISPDEVLDVKYENKQYLVITNPGIEMPNLTDITVPCAESYLKSLGWEGTLTLPNGSKGKVTEQQPAKGTALDRDTVVELTVPAVLGK